MATRTARGTATLKTSGTTLTGASFTLPAGHSLDVGIGCENSQGPPTTVTMNGRTLKRKQTQNNATASLNCSVWHKSRAAVPQTGTIVATWSSAIAARAMFASSLDESMRIDKTISQSDTATTTPNTGTTATLTGSDDFLFACFASKGPSGDTAATGSSHTLGQRAGTTGGAATSNVTVQELYSQLSVNTAVAGSLSGVTQRRWSNCLIAVQESLNYRAAMAPSDLELMRGIFEGKGTPIPQENMAWYYNESEDRWEVYNVSAGVEASTLIAHYDVLTGGWTEV